MSWPTVQLRRLFRVVNGGTPTPDDVNWGGDVKWATPIDLAQTHGAQLFKTDRTLTDVGLASGSRSVRGGSLLLSTRAPIGYVSETASRMAFNQGCRGLEPITDLHVRYFRYQLEASGPVLKSMGQGSTFSELSGDAVASLGVRCPPTWTQQAIADFLDNETARIDTLIAKKRRMIALMHERSAGVVELAIRRLVEEYGSVPLKRRVGDVTVGIVVTPSNWYAPQGVPALRGVNVSPGRIDSTDLVFLSEEGHRLHQKSALRAGDLVVVRTGQAGAAAIVPRELADCNCIDLLLIRPGQVLPAFLLHVLNSDWTGKHVERYSVGSIQSHFNVSALRELPVPDAPLDRQEATAQAIREQAFRWDQTIERLGQQVELLQEHRQALITAAVTGELEVPGVAA